MIRRLNDSKVTITEMKNQEQGFLTICFPILFMVGFFNSAPMHPLHFTPTPPVRGQSTPVFSC